MRSAFGFGVVLALVLGAPALVRADDQQPGATHRHCPTCGAELPAERCPTCGLVPGQRAAPAPQSEEDRELDRALRREYGDPNAPAPRRRIELVPAPPPPPPPPPPARPRHRDSDDEDEFHVHLGVLGAHWAARMASVRVQSSRDGVLGDSVSLSGGHSSVADLSDWSQTQLFRAWIDLGPWFSFDGGANRSWFRDSGVTQRDFAFKGFQFGQGSQLDTKFESLVADFNFVVHPLHGCFGHLDILMGFRYLWSNTEFTGDGLAGGIQPGPPVIVIGGSGTTILPGPFPVPVPAAAGPTRVSQRLEAFMPTIGLGGTVRPVHTKLVSLEIFARGRVGGFDWEEQGFHHHDWNSNGGWVNKKFYAYSAELDGGVSFVVLDTIGFTAGYHFDLAHIEKRDNGDESKADWKTHGPYGGVSVQF